MSILNQYLKKLKVKSFSDLNDEERATYRSWEEALRGRKLTDEEVGAFLQKEKEETITKLATQALKSREDIFLKMKLDFLIRLEKFLSLPEMERKMTEVGIKQMLGE